MNFDEFAARYHKSDETTPTRGCDSGPDTEPVEVVLAGIVQGIDSELCCIDINGVKYDIPRISIGDVQLLSAIAKREAGKDDKSEAPDDTEIGANDVVMFTLKSNTVMCQRTPVQAGFVAAVGTWISLVPGATAAAQAEPAPASASA